jgi:hypothetical protein
MKRWGRIVIGALCLFGMMACSQARGYMDIVSEKGISKPYLQTLDRWTRSQKAYSQFETKARIEATLRGPEFNRAYIEEYSRLYQLNADERKKMEETLAASDLTEFLFYAYVPNKAENDFDRQGSIWSIFIINSKGEKEAPVEIRRIDPMTPVVTEFFPYINPYYGIAYRLRFSKAPESGRDGPIKLVFASVIGKVELEFDVK